MPQQNAFILFLVLSVLVILTFVLVARSTRQPAEMPYAAVRRIRRWFFLGLTVALGAFLWLTLPRMPYPDLTAQPDRVVHVRAKQFFFEFSDKAFLEGGSAAQGDDEEGTIAASISPVKVGELVEYRVTSGDATHGFGVYDTKGRLISQTQAMPGYINRLRLRFPDPGTYPVLCLEYCGLAHHVMRGAIEVVAR